MQPTTTQEDERVLAVQELLKSKRRISALRRPLIRQLTKIPKPNISDYELIRRVRKGDETGNFLLLCKHYKYILAKVIEATNGTHFSEDVLQAGIVGLYEAARRFDLKYKNKFLTYAHSWILKYVYIEMREEVLPLGGMKIGRDMKERLYNYIKYKMQGLSDDDIKDALHLSEQTLAEVKALNAKAAHTKSIDMNKDATGVPTEVVVDKVQSTEDTAIGREFKRYLEKVSDYVHLNNDAAGTFMDLELGLKGNSLLEKPDVCKELHISQKEYDSMHLVCNAYIKLRMELDGWYEGDSECEEPLLVRIRRQEKLIRELGQKR